MTSKANSLTAMGRKLNLKPAAGSTKSNTAPPSRPSVPSHSTKATTSNETSKRRHGDDEEEQTPKKLKPVPQPKIKDSEEEIEEIDDDEIVVDPKEDDDEEGEEVKAKEDEEEEEEEDEIEEQEEKVPQVTAMKKASAKATQPQAASPKKQESSPTTAPKKQTTVATAAAATTNDHHVNKSSTTTSSTHATSSSSSSSSGGHSTSNNKLVVATPKKTMIPKALPDIIQLMVEKLLVLESSKIENAIKECGHFDPLELWQFTKGKDQELTDPIRASYNIHKTDMTKFTVKKSPYTLEEAKNGFMFTMGAPSSGKKDGVVPPLFLTPAMTMVYLGAGLEKKKATAEPNQKPKFFAGFSTKLPETEPRYFQAQINLFHIHSHMFCLELLKKSISPEFRTRCWPNESFEAIKAKVEGSLMSVDPEKASSITDAELEKMVERTFLSGAQKLFNRKQYNGAWEDMMTCNRTLTRDMSDVEKNKWQKDKPVFEAALKADPSKVSVPNKLKLQQTKVWCQPYIEFKGKRLDVDPTDGLVENPCPAVAFPMNFAISVFTKDSTTMKDYGVQARWNPWKDTAREVIICKKLPKDSSDQPPPKTAYDDEEEEEEEEKTEESTNNEDEGW